MNSYAISGFINALTVSILGITVYFKGRKNAANIKYSLFCFFVAFWSFAYFLWQISENEYSSLFYCRALMAGAIFIPVCFLDFVVTLIGFKGYRKIVVRIGYTIFFIFFITNFTPYFIKSVSPRMGFPYWPDQGVLFTPFLTLWLGYCVYPCLLLFQGYRNATGIKRNQIKYVLLGIIIGYGSGSTNYFLWYNIPVPPVGNYIVPLFVATMAFAIIRYRLMDINIAIRKIITNSIITIVITIGIICIVLLSLPIQQKAIIALLFGILITSYLPKVKTTTENRINHILYKGKYSYQEILDDLIEQMPFIPRIEELFQHTITTLVDTLGVKTAAVFTLDQSSGSYSIKEQIGLDNADLTVPADSELIEWIKTNEEILVREELEKTLDKKEMIPINKILEKLNSSVCIPAMLETELIGFIALGEKHSGEMYSHIDLRILQRLGTMLALSLNNKRIIEELHREQQIVEVTRKRLDAITTMAFGIADRIRNYITSAFTFFELYPDRFKEFEGKLNDEEKESVVPIFKQGKSSIEKTVRIAKDIADMCKPKISRMENHDPKIIMDMADALTEDLKPDMEEKEITIKKNISGNPPATYFDKEAIKTVLFHLMQNSIHAIGIEGNIEIKVQGPVKREEKEYLRITVKDNGAGIPEENKESIFNPFFCTKGTAGGLGLGLTICQFIIAQHDGAIGILHTNLDRGTTMYVDLPIIKEPPKSEADYKDILGQFPGRS